MAWYALLRMVEEAGAEAFETSVERLFLELDADGGGEVDASELKEGLARMDVELSASGAEALVRAIDADGKILLTVFGGGLSLLQQRCAGNGLKEEHGAWRMVVG